MKIRQGFVSNSSSSSFIVGLPKGLSHKEKRDFLLKKMDVNEDSFFFFAAKGVANCIIESTPIETIEDMMDDYCCDSLEDFKKDYPSFEELFHRHGAYELDVYRGSASNEDCEIGGQLFCEMEWRANDDDFFMDKDASY
jgi:hypothetical protein